MVDGPSDGRVAVNRWTGAVTYVPNAGFSGTDTFSYTVTGIDGYISAPATVTIHVG